MGNQWMTELANLWQALMILAETEQLINEIPFLVIDHYESPPGEDSHLIQILGERSILTSNGMNLDAFKGCDSLENSFLYAGFYNDMSRLREFGFLSRKTNYYAAVIMLINVAKVDSIEKSSKDLYEI